MRDIPKNNIFTEPEGYFDKLPEEIISRRKKQVRQVFIMRSAVAAMLILGLSFLLVFLNQPQEPAYTALTIEDEVEMYISSGYWNAEDVLMLSDDPDAILDEIIALEYLAYLPEPDPFDDDYWF